MPRTIHPHNPIIRTRTLQTPIKHIPRIGSSHHIKRSPQRPQIHSSPSGTARINDPHLLRFRIVPHHFQIFTCFVGDAFGVA